MNSEKIPTSEIEALDADLSFIGENNIDAEAAVEDFRSALYFATTFPESPTTKKVLEHIRDRIENLKPIEIEIIPMAA